MDRRDFVKFQQWWLLVVAILIATVLSYGVIVVNRNVNGIERLVKTATDISSDQARFRDNFSNYMTCLVVADDNLVAQVGEETYIEICKQLLYRGIDPIPPTIKPDLSILQPSLPPTSTTTTTRGGEN